MRKCNVIMCWIDSDKLIEKPITQIYITKSQDFSDLKTKIECKS